MARIRSVKPALRTSRVVASWPFEVRYFWVLLWGYLDDKGRGLDIPKAIAGDCFPHDDRVTHKVVDRWLGIIAAAKAGPDRDAPLCRYEVAGTRYLHSVYWEEHQKPNRPSPSQHPPCPVHEGLTESLTEPPLSPQVLELEGLTEGEVEGAAREPLTEPPGPPPQDPPPQDPPPRTCSEHATDPDPPPCGACADARRRHEAWQADRRARLDAAPRCPQHRGQLAANCALCASERKAAPWPDPSPVPPDDPGPGTPRPTARTSTSTRGPAASAPPNASPPTTTRSSPSADSTPSPSTSSSPAPAASDPPPSTRPAPADGQVVWVAARRRGIVAHHPDQAAGFTTCRRSMRTGELITAATARTYDAAWCATCWPPATEEDPCPPGR